MVGEKIIMPERDTDPIKVILHDLKNDGIKAIGKAVERTLIEDMYTISVKTAEPAEIIDAIEAIRHLDGDEKAREAAKRAYRNLLDRGMYRPAIEIVGDEELVKKAAEEGYESYMKRRKYKYAIDLAEYLSDWGLAKKAAEEGYEYYIKERLYEHAIDFAKDLGDEELAKKAAEKGYKYYIARGRRDKAAELKKYLERALGQK